MKQPVFPLHGRLSDPFAKWAKTRPIAAAHGNGIQRETQVSLDMRSFVVNDASSGRIESPPKLCAIACPSRRPVLVLPRVREERDHDWREAVEEPPPGFRILPSLHIHL